MFSKEIFVNRRSELKKRVGCGLIILFGNNDASRNYPANAYRMRQDSSFLYYFGQKRDGLVGVIDIDNNCECLYGDDIDIDDIIWYGFVPSVAALANEVGVSVAKPMSDFYKLVEEARKKEQTIHFLPQYRSDIQIMLSDLMGFHPSQSKENASVALIKAIVDMRAIKKPEEIEQLESVAQTGYLMHTTAMKLCKPGVTEMFIAGQIEGIAMSYGDSCSFQSILSTHGEVAHGYPSHRPMEAGRLMLCDAGAENDAHYCSDHTRVTPVSGRFTQQQRNIHKIVEAAHDIVIAKARPGVKWLDMHLDACRVIAEGLKGVGLMKGNVEDAVQSGAHAMFMTHGLGHMMGMDVHDMEGLGQNYVGFDDEVQPSTQFGLNCLRCGRRLQEGFVMTDEPGIYFIPQLIDLWRSQGMHKDFINYDEVEKYREFGGIRIENDILITADGNRYIGDQMIPYRAEDIEDFIAQ